MEFGIFDQGGNLVFIRKKGTDSYCGCSRGVPGQEKDKKGGDNTGHSFQGLGDPCLSVTYWWSTGN